MPWAYVGRGSAGWRAVMQDDGNLVVLDGDGFHFGSVQHGNYEPEVLPPFPAEEMLEMALSPDPLIPDQLLVTPAKATANDGALANTGPMPTSLSPKDCTITADDFSNLWRDVKRVAARSAPMCLQDDPDDDGLCEVHRHHAIMPRDEIKFWTLQLHRLVMVEVARAVEHDDDPAVKEDVDEEKQRRKFLELDDPLDQLDLESIIRARAWATAPQPEKPLFEAGVVTFSSAFRYQGQRNAVAFATNRRTQDLAKAAAGAKRIKLRARQLGWKRLHITDLAPPDEAVQYCPPSEPKLTVGEAAATTEGSTSLLATTTEAPEPRLGSVEATPTRGGGVVSVHIGGAGTRLGEAMWHEMADAPPDTVFWGEGSDSAKGSGGGRYPRALFVDTDRDAIDHVLGRRSLCRGVVGAEQTFVCKNVAIDSTFTEVDEALESSVLQEEIADALRVHVEEAPCFQGAVLTHALGGGTGSAMGGHFSKLLADEYPKAASIAYQLADDGRCSTTYGPINELNELLGLAACGQAEHAFGQSVLLSNSAMHRHACHDLASGARGFESVNSLIAKSIVLTTSSLRGDSQFSDAFGPLNPLQNLEALTSHLSSNLDGALPRYSCLAYDTRPVGVRVWSSNSIFSRQDLQLSPFSVDSALRLRSVTFMAGGADVPKSSSWCGNKPPSVSPLCAKLADERSFLAGNVSLGALGAGTEKAQAGLFGQPTVCSLVQSTGCKHYMDLRLSRYEKSRKMASHIWHMISNNVNESSFTDAAGFVRDVSKRYEVEEEKCKQVLQDQPVLPALKLKFGYHDFKREQDEAEAERTAEAVAEVGQVAEAVAVAEVEVERAGEVDEKEQTGGEAEGEATLKDDGGAAHDDEELQVITSAADKAPSPPGSPTEPPPADTLAVNRSMGGGEFLLSTSGRYKAIMQADGNLCVYAIFEGGRMEWRYGTVNFGGYPADASGEGAFAATMQADGNLTVTWASATDPSAIVFKFGTVQAAQYEPTTSDEWRAVMQDDGNLVVYDGDQFKFGTVQHGGYAPEILQPLPSTVPGM